MKKLFIVVVCLTFCLPVFANGNNGNNNGANQDHTCQGGHNCNGGTTGGTVSNSGNSTNTNTNSNVANGGSATSYGSTATATGGNGGNASSSSNVSASANNNGVNVEGDDVKSLSQFFTSSPGKDELQVGSAVFGGLSVSNDSASNDLRQNIGAVVGAYKAGLLDKDSAQYVVHEIVSEVKDSSKGDSCFGIKQGRKRSLSNLFKLIC